MSEIVKTVLENTQKINQLADEKKQINETTQCLTWNVKDKFRSQIRALENERDQAVKEIEETAKNENDLRTQQIKTLNDPIQQAKKTIKFLSLKETAAQVININKMVVRGPYNSGNGFKEDLNFLVQEPYLNLRLFIVENNKPVNHFSLIVFGQCLFINEYDNPILREPKQQHEKDGWNNATYFKDQTARIDLTLKTAATPEELKTYLAKNRDKILKEFLTEYEKTKQQYEDTKKLYTLEDFKPILETMKDY